MCSHYTPVKSISQLHDIFGVQQVDRFGKPDMFPGYVGLFIRQHPHADVGDEAVPEREAVTGRWGLIPHWSRDEQVKGTFNARSETVADKPSFRDAWRKGQRCIIPAMSVFEPDWRSGKYVPAEVSRADGKPIGIAGIWSTWRATDRWVESFTMLTLNADTHPIFSQLHKPHDEKRMVVILPEEKFKLWLSGSQADAASLIKQYPAEHLRMEDTL